MKKYQCSICSYIYDEEIEKVKFNDLPDDWQCPLVSFVMEWED